jgi:hypothetical protein
MGAALPSIGRAARGAGEVWEGQGWEEREGKREKQELKIEQQARKI